MFNKDKVISDLENFVKYVEANRFKETDGISRGGLKPEEFDKYPPGTPGIHRYWDADDEELVYAKALIQFFKDGIDQPRNPLLVGNYIRFKAATIYYIMLNPQFKNIMLAECGRGIEIILAKCIRDWENIFCYDIKEIYGRVIKEYFNDKRITFFNMQSCHFDPMLLKDYYDKNILLVANHTHPVVLRVFMNWSCFGGIIKEGVPVGGSGKWPNATFWKEHKPEEMFEDSYKNLKERVKNEFGFVF